MIKDWFAEKRVFDYRLYWFIWGLEFNGARARNMYVDEVDFRETLAYDQLIGLVFTEFVHRQMQQLEELETACVKTGIAHSPVTKMREHCEITDEDDRWLTYADKSESDRVKRDKNHNRQKILRFGVIFGRNDLNLENHLQIGYNSKTIKRLWTY